MCFFTIFFWAIMIALRLMMGSQLDMAFWTLAVFGWLIFMMLIAPDPKAVS